MANTNCSSHLWLERFISPPPPPPFFLINRIWYSNYNKAKIHGFITKQNFLLLNRVGYSKTVRSNRNYGLKRQEGKVETIASISRRLRPFRLLLRFQKEKRLFISSLRRSKRVPNLVKRAPFLVAKISTK